MEPAAMKNWVLPVAAAAACSKPSPPDAPPPPGADSADAVIVTLPSAGVTGSESPNGSESWATVISSMLEPIATALSVTMASVPLPPGPACGPDDAQPKRIDPGLTMAGGQNTVRPVLPRKPAFVTET
jgi:hypothetical protein